MKRSSVVLPSLLLWVAALFGCALVLAQGSSGSDGWYTPGQAANGAKAYQKACAGCHGPKLQGGMAPALVGKIFWLTYGGKKVSTLWSDIHTQMPMSAPGSVSARNSIDIMAFLFEKNGVLAGSTPLNDTTDLSKALPSKK